MFVSQRASGGDAAGEHGQGWVPVGRRSYMQPERPGIGMGAGQEFLKSKKVSLVGGKSESCSCSDRIVDYCFPASLRGALYMRRDISYACLS